MAGALTDIPGIRVGHAQDRRARTGCTVILCERGAVAGVDIRGSATGTRLADLIAPGRIGRPLHAILLTGGSAFGLDAAGGVMRYLERRGIGYDAGVARVPAVVAAVLFDLAEGNPRVRPDAAMALRACRAASARGLREGCWGAGTGATVGKIFGHARCMRGGIGTAAAQLCGGVRVAALVAVNALGDVVDPRTGEIVAGARTRGGKGFIGSAQALRRRIPRRYREAGNTTLVVVATSARLSRDEAAKVAQMAHDGLARTIRPVHTPYDGDVAFALSLGDLRGSLLAIGSAASEVVEEAVLRAVRIANALPVEGSGSVRERCGGPGG